MNAPAKVRIDKWLWAVRVYKTRSMAAAACRAGRVIIAGHAVKASREARINDIVQAKTGDITRTLKVLGLLEQRVGAAVAGKFMEDLTPSSELERRKETLRPLFPRAKGAGRPTKKDRRAMGEIEGLI